MAVKLVCVSVLVLACVDFLVTKAGQILFVYCIDSLDAKVSNCIQK